jgi:glucose-1-phosphate adenylyltransferase
MVRYHSFPHVKPFALAGGSGSRLLPLTAKRAKPAVPFGGKWAIIDPVLWCLYYSGLRDVGVLVQKNAVSLNEHIGRSWPRKLDGGAYFQILPPEGFDGRHEYLGTADAVYQHMHQSHGKEHVLIVSGDHLYKADFSHFIEFHEDSEADLTIMAITVPIAEASAFGVLGTNGGGKVLTFKEKPAKPRHIPENEGLAYCSMGVYLFKRDALKGYLTDDAADKVSSHDFGKDIIPRMVRDKRKVYAYPFSENVAKGQKSAFWRDVGTIDAYHQEHMNLCGDDPVFNVFAEQWRIVTGHDGTAGFKSARRVIIDHSMGCGSSIVDMSELRYTVLGRRVIVREGCSLNESIVFDQVHFEGKCKLHRTIVDVDPTLRDNQRVVVPHGTEIGFSRDDDEARGFTVTDSGITVVPYTWFADKTITVE